MVCVSSGRCPRKLPIETRGSGRVPTPEHSGVYIPLIRTRPEVKRILSSNTTDKNFTHTNIKPVLMDQEPLKLKAFQNFEECFADKAKMDQIDLNQKDWLVEWFYDTRKYGIEEYFTGRILLGQMAAAARMPVDAMSPKFDAEWTTKGNNFLFLKKISERLAELEGSLFQNSKEVIDVVSGARKEALFKATAADADKGGFDL